MNESPNIAALGAAIGDPARAIMLDALLSGRALTATELALQAGITQQTASTHLAKLRDTRLIKAEKHGRHRYFSMASEDASAVLEVMMGFADRHGHTHMRTGPKDPTLRQARVCYNHLAGELGVQLYDSLIEQEFLVGETQSLTKAGEAFFDDFMPSWRGLLNSPRPLCKTCLDWNVRRTHLAGSLGQAVLNQIYLRGWAERDVRSRAVHFTDAGTEAFEETFPL